MEPLNIYCGKPPPEPFIMNVKDIPYVKEGFYGLQFADAFCGTNL